MQLTITQLHRDSKFTVTGEGSLLHDFSNFTQLVEYLSGEFEEELEDQSDLIDDLEKELQDAETKIEDLESDKKGLEATISKLEDTITTLQANLAQCNTSSSLLSVVIPTDTAPTSTSTPSAGA